MQHMRYSTNHHQSIRILVLYRGNFAIDEVVLRFQGITDFEQYKVDRKCPDDELTLDFFLPENPYHNALPLPKVVLFNKAKL